MVVRLAALASLTMMAWLKLNGLGPPGLLNF